jgi:hypothetical protein
MAQKLGPRPGTKLARVNELLRRPGGATLNEINAATAQDTWSYKTNGTYLAKKYGGKFKASGGAGSRRFWIE